MAKNNQRMKADTKKEIITADLLLSDPKIWKSLTDFLRTHDKDGKIGTGAITNNLKINMLQKDPSDPTRVIVYLEGGKGEVTDNKDLQQTYSMEMLLKFANTEAPKPNLFTQQPPTTEKSEGPAFKKSK